VSDEPVTDSINPADPALVAAVTAVVDSRVREILTAASDRIDGEAGARLRRGHDVEHTAGWREAAKWQREQAVQA
jgi:hypothetical protein